MKHFASPKIGRFLLSIFLGFLVTISISALATDGHSAKATVQVISAPYISAPAQDRQNLTIAQSTTQKSLLQTGIQLYEAERFSEAINVWNQALTASADTANSLNQALLLSNLSLAYQHLGQLTSAEETITKSLALLENLADFSDASTYSETLAKALNTQGRLQWTTGDIESALATWRQATAAYRQADQERGILLSLLNQAKALQTLGFHLQSQAILENEVPPLLQDSQLEPQLKATGWWHLGNAQRQFGELDDSKKSLEKSLDILQREESQSLQGSILLDLGNTERALGNSANAIGMREEAQGHRERALEIYQQIARSTPDSLNGLQATLNQLSLRIESKQLSEANRLWPDILPGLEQLSPSRTGIYAQLNFANSLIQLMEAIAAEEQPKSISAKQAVASGPTWEEIDAILVRAIGQAQSLDDAIAESYGIGQRGRLYESRKQWSTAKKLTQQALRLTELNSYPDGRYRWEWQLGRVLTQQGQKNEAIQVYQAAVKTLDSVRADLRFFNAEVQFSFRDNVEP
ncbi:MAG: tetratricopeptide repeat protein, partial [Cyanobacteria bacterium P01_F01_bin.13]